MRIGSLFSGIGGLELGLEWSGLGATVWQVEADPYCRDVLARHWPHARRYDDVRTVGATVMAFVDLICGGFPCQDVSSAGKGAGLAGERSGLWREYARIIGELRPRWVVAENVASGANRWVDSVCRDLAELGYETLPLPLSAEDVGAPHLRRRVFIVAHAVPIDAQMASSQDVAYADGQRLEKCRRPGAAAAQQPWPWSNRPPVSPVCGVDDGFSYGLDRTRRLKALGNSVVPQCSEVVGHVIRELGG